MASSPSMERIGVHLSIAGGLHRALEAARRLKIGAVQIFLKNSNQWKARPYSGGDIALFHNALTSVPGLKLFAHAGYLINPAGSGETLRKSIIALRDEIRRAALLGVPFLVLHPGSHGGRGVERGIERTAVSLDRALDQEPGPVILLETTAGQGASIGHRFEQLRHIIDASSNPRRLAVCMDTCHIFAAGYDISDEARYNAVIDEFDRIVGLKRLQLIHLNDSKRECGSRVDRHEHIGKGRIGSAGFRRILHDPRLAGIPIVLETPKFNDDEADRINLSRVRRLMK